MLHKDYDRKSSVEKKSVVVVLKGLDAKMNWLAVNRQSQSDFHSFTTDLKLVSVIASGHGQRRKHRSSLYSKRFRGTRLFAKALPSNGCGIFAYIAVLA
jgi:hypothetical protein